MALGIYALLNPQTQEIRYIGLSKNIEHRYKQHCNKIYNHTKGIHLQNWLKQLDKLNLKPELYILELCGLEQLRESEQFWIQYFKGLGCKLTNISSGGEDFNVASSTRQKISKSLKGHKVKSETREKLRQSALKQPKHIYTEEQKKKLSESRKGMKFSQEHRKNIGLAQKGRKVPNKKGLVIIDNLGNVFVSASKAAKFHNIHVSTVCRLVSGKMKTSSTGVHFRKAV